MFINVGSAPFEAWIGKSLENACFAGSDDQLTDLLRTQSYARMVSIDPNLSELFGNHTICEHFYGYLKVHRNERLGAIDFIQHLKKITGCLDIVDVAISTTGKINRSYFDELDLTNLKEIDYDGALCGNLFALRIMRNVFLQRIDINENLILNGAYFIRNNAEKVEIYSGGNLNSTFQWNDPEACLLDEPEHLLLHCKNIIGSVSVNQLSPLMNERILDVTGIKKIYGQLIISPANIDDNTNLSHYQHLEIVAHYKDAVIIENNKYLYGIEALTQMRVTPPENFPKEALKGWKPFVLRNNGKICGNHHYEKSLQEIVSTKVELSDYCSKLEESLLLVILWLSFNRAQDVYSIIHVMNIGQMTAYSFYFFHCNISTIDVSFNTSKSFTMVLFYKAYRFLSNIPAHQCLKVVPGVVKADKKLLPQKRRKLVERLTASKSIRKTNL